MIIGKLKDLNRYIGLNKNLDTAISYILSTNLSSLENGRYPIDGESVYLNKFTYMCSPEEECLLEGHRNYLDIHIVIKGEELLGYSDESDVTPATEYDPTNDFIKYDGKVRTYCRCGCDDFIITFPEDIHMPKISTSDNLVEKAVCKVLIK